MEKRTKRNQVQEDWLSSLVEGLTAELEVTGSIPGTGPTLRVLKWLRNEGTAFALQMARPSHARMTM